MQARMKNPGVVIPDAMTAIRSLNEAIKQGGVPPRTLDLVHLRASQINGCSVCVGAAAKAKKDGETNERLFTLVAWRDTPSSPTPNAPHWPSPRPSPGSATGPTRCPTRYGRRRPATTTSQPWPHWSLDCRGEHLQPRQRRHQADPQRIPRLSPSVRATSGPTSAIPPVPRWSSAMATGSRLSGTSAPTTERPTPLHEGHPDQSGMRESPPGVEIADQPVRCCTERCSPGGHTRAGGSVRTPTPP